MKKLLGTLLLVIAMLLAIGNGHHFGDLLAGEEDGPGLMGSSVVEIVQI